MRLHSAEGKPCCFQFCSTTAFTELSLEKVKHFRNASIPPLNSCVWILDVVSSSLCMQFHTDKWLEMGVYS